MSKINRDAFKGCDKLDILNVNGVSDEFVSMPNKSTLPQIFDHVTCCIFSNQITEIPDVFHDMNNLRFVSIPNAVTVIHGHPFDGCRNIKEVYFDGTGGRFFSIFEDEHNCYLDSFSASYNIICQECIIKNAGHDIENEDSMIFYS